MAGSIAMGVPKMVGLFHGKIPSFEMDDDWGYPCFRKPPNRRYGSAQILRPLPPLEWWDSVSAAGTESQQRIAIFVPHF